MTRFTCSCSRRDFLARGLYGIGMGAALPIVLSRTTAALAAQALQGTSVERHPERILVVLELAGGNDGLNTRNLLVNLGTSQSLAVRSGKHSPLVFDDPARFRREGTEAQKEALGAMIDPRVTSNSTLDFLAATARNAADSSDFVRQASA